MNNEKEKFSERLRVALVERNMRQSELCKRTKIPRSAMSQYLSGVFEPKQDRIFSISEALGVNEAWLMGYDVPMEKNHGNSFVDFSDKAFTEEDLKQIEKLIELFKNIPSDDRRMVLEMIKVALNKK